MRFGRGIGWGPGWGLGRGRRRFQVEFELAEGALRRGNSRRPGAGSGIALAEVDMQRVHPFGFGRRWAARRAGPRAGSTQRCRQC